ncbi:T9SS type B sorting domain-containing protein [Hymenobacter terricola]|uniref:T9SS type B sorting domain-containing protein n=1 Tax=Hymenobacter terricola TaxID=2819236 RepID=UPI001B301B3B|nr:gliding motility-associated C-terminal domain-containing protein [Hymenobacter terricola]
MFRFYQLAPNLLQWVALFLFALPLSLHAQTPVGCDLVALDAPAPLANSFFGNRVSIGTRFAITGANGTLATGATPGKAYIYEHVGTGWVYRQTLSEANSLTADVYGSNVYIDDSTAVVSAYGFSRPGAPGRIGAVYIYTRQGSQWVQTGFIANPSPLASTFGWAIAKSGTDLVVGNGDSNISLTKSVYVYRQPAVPTQPWALVATLTPQAANTGYDYGYSVAIDGDNLIVGAVDRFTRGRNAAHFYHRTPAGVWQQAQVESYVSGALASNTVGVRGNYAVIGTDSNQGVRIYLRTAAGWQLQQTLFCPDSFSGRYGLTVAISNKVLLVGGPTGGMPPVYSGVVFRYELRNGTWQFRRRYAVPQSLSGDVLGAWVGLDPRSQNLIIGAPGRTSGGIAGAGQAFVEWAPAIEPPAPFCVTDAPVSLPATATGGTWGGPGITNAQTGLFNPAVAGAGTHTITYSLAQGNCVRVDTALITVRSILRIIRPVLPPLACSRDTTITLTANAPGGTWSGPGIISAQAGTFRPSTAGPGRHLLTYTASSAAFCRPQDTLSLVVLPVAVRVQAVGRRLSCARDTTIALQATPAGGTWLGAGILPSTAGTFSSVVAGPGRHLLTYRFNAGTACGGQDTLSVIVQPVAVRVLTAPPPPFCRLDTLLRLTATPAGGTWRGPGIVNAQQGIFSASAAGAGRRVLYYEVGTGACRASDSLAIVLAPAALPVLEGADAFTLRCGAQSAWLSVRNPVPAAQYEWQYAATTGGPWQVPGPGNGQSAFQATQAGAYRIRLLQGNCSATSLAVQVRIESAVPVFVPNIITPNHDGHNDVFELTLQSPRTFHLQVYSRWGQEVFHTDTYGDFWSGTGAPAGIYYYLWRYSTECEAQEKLVKGWIEVVR